MSKNHNNKKNDFEAKNEDLKNEETNNATEDVTNENETLEDETSAGENAKEKTQTKENENEEKKGGENNQAKEDETDWKNKYLRLLAEFDNFRKRTEKEKENLIGFGASMILGKILPLIDNMDRAHEALTEEDKKTSMGEGLDKVYKQLEKLLEDLDVKPIEALGKPFDPELHNAVMTDEESDAEVDTITQELQKGYTYKGDVLRHTMVKVKK